MKANSAVGMPASAPPIIGRKSTRATHSPHSSGYGTPRTSSVTNTTMPAMSEVSRLPSMYPATAWFTSADTAVTLAARAGLIWPRIQTRIFGASISSSRTRTKIVSSSMTREKAPAPMLRAGLLSDWA